MKKSKIRILILFLSISLIIGLTACSSGDKDPVKGTWVGEDDFYGDVTWEFDGKDGCSLKNDVTDQKGTYELADDTMSILLELWENPVVYNYTAGNGTLSLEDPSGMAPNYDLKKK